MNSSARALLLLLPLIAPPLAAEVEWSTRSEIGFVAARGNTSTETANAKLELARETDRWKNTFATSGLYGKNSGVASAQRWDARYQLDHALSDRSFWFGSGRYEDDRYSGFDYQAIISTGFGRRMIDTNQTKLSMQIGAGFRMLRPEDLVRDDNNEVIQRIPGERDQDVVGNGSLTFEHNFNDATKVRNTLLVESGRANTLGRNDIALEVKMTEVLALSVALSVRHNTAPQDGLKRTDTLTTINLVYLKNTSP
jgi:putative salt-induced outer membrane protein